MTTTTGERIAPDRALVINPIDLGITITGRELEGLFVRFLARHGKTDWKLELSPAGEFIFTPPRPHPFDLHLAATADALNEWNADAGGAVTGAEIDKSKPA